MDEELHQMEHIQIKDLAFQIHISEPKIRQRIASLAAQMNIELATTSPIFIAVLNGSFIFAADLLRQLDFACEIQFVKVASYHGMQSSGQVQELIGLNIPIEGREVIILEDIIDSGLTMDYLVKELAKAKPSQIKICSLLLKPKALKVPLEVHFTGFEVGNEFLVGYGLDYDGFGRNLPHIYQAVEPTKE